MIVAAALVDCSLYELYFIRGTLTGSDLTSFRSAIKSHIQHLANPSVQVYSISDSTGDSLLNAGNISIDSGHIVSRSTFDLLLVSPLTYTFPPYIYRMLHDRIKVLGVKI